MGIERVQDQTLKSKRRFGKLGALACAIALLAAACGDDGGSKSATATTVSGGSATATAATPKQPFTVAIVSDMTGASSGPLGIPGANGIQLALKQANDAGGVNGHMIEIKIHDTLSTADGGATAAQAAVAGKPTVIALPGVSSAVNGGLPTYSAAKIPAVAVPAFDNMVFPTTPWWFSIGTTTRQYAEMFLAQLKNQLGGTVKGKKIAAEYIAVPSGQAVSDATVALLKKEGAEVVGNYGLANGSSSFASQAQEIVSSGAVAVTVSDSATAAVIITKALQTAGFTGYILGSQGSNDANTLKTVNNEKFHVIRPVNEPTAGDQMSTDAAKYNLSAAGAYFGQGYAVGSFIVQVLKTCTDTCSPADFTKAAENLGTVNLPAGLAFGPFKVAADRHYMLTKVSWWNWDAATQKPKQVSTVDIPEGAPLS